MAFLRRDSSSAKKRFAFALAAGDKAMVFKTAHHKANVLGKSWHMYEIIYSASNPSWLALKIDGKEILPKTEFKNIGYCNQFDRLRIGNYRSGANKKLGKVNFTSVSEYRNLEIIKIN